jgi:hypothetical protein
LNEFKAFFLGDFDDLNFFGGLVVAENLQTVPIVLDSDQKIVARQIPDPDELDGRRQHVILRLDVGCKPGLVQRVGGQRFFSSLVNSVSDDKWVVGDVFDDLFLFFPVFFKFF